jgi:hypothetical protein
MSTLKLPGAGEAASEEPRGPYDKLAFEGVRPPLAFPGGCRPSRSKLDREVYGRDGWLNNVF